MAYQDSLKNYRDLKNIMDTAIEEAVDKNKIEIAKNAILEGFDNNLVAKLTGLSVAQIEKLRNEKNN